MRLIGINACFTLLVVTAYALNPGKRLREFSTLSEQLQELSSSGHKDLVLSSQQKLLYSTGRVGPSASALREILQSENYKRLFLSGKIKFDGKLDDWNFEDQQYRDLPDESCIQDLKHGYDRENGQLYLAWELLEIEKCRQLWRKWLPAVELSWLGEPGSPVVLAPIRAAPGGIVVRQGKVKDFPLISKISKGKDSIEAIIPLRGFFSDRPVEVRLRPAIVERVFHDVRPLVSSFSTQPLDYNNAALYLYLKLLHVPLMNDSDPIRAALALAAARTYNILDAEAKTLYEEELKNILLWYEDCVYFQRNQGLNWQLEKAGFLGKVLWAEPQLLAGTPAYGAYLQKPLTARQFRQLFKITGSDRQLREILLENKLINKDLHFTKVLIERFIKKNLEYRGPLLRSDLSAGHSLSNQQAQFQRELRYGQQYKVWAGERRELHELNFIPFQLDHYRRTGSFLGNEQTLQELTAAFLKSVGIIPLQLKRKMESSGKLQSELLLFNGNTQAFDKPGSFSNQQGLEEVSWLFNSRHPWLSVAAVKEQAQARFVQVQLEAGIPEAAFELLIFFQDKKAFKQSGNTLISHK